MTDSWTQNPQPQPTAFHASTKTNTLAIIALVAAFFLRRQELFAASSPEVRLRRQRSKATD
jgi:hypothetical protein